MGLDTAATAQAARRTTLRIWIDFVCPYCLLGEQVVRAATDGLDVDIIWMPFELREYPIPTLRPEDDYLPRAWKEGVYPAAERLGVNLRLPTVSPQPYTRKAFLGLQYAAENGRADDYVDAVLRAFFQKDRDIGHTEVLKAILGDIGLDPAGLEAVLASSAYGDRHDTLLRQAREAGIRAVPSIAVADRLFSGVPLPKVLRAEIISQQG